MLLRMGELLNCGVDPETEELFKQPVVLIKEHEHSASSAGIIETLTLPVGTIGFLDMIPTAFEDYSSKAMVCSVKFYFKLGNVKASVSSFVPATSLLKLERSNVPEEYQLKG